MSFRVQIRRDLAIKWTVNNPILLDGELGYETDSRLMKIGDGFTTWNYLQYWRGNVGPGGATGPSGATGASEGPQDLQSVTDNGSSTTNTISIEPTGNDGLIISADNDGSNNRYAIVSNYGASGDGSTTANYFQGNNYNGTEEGNEWTSRTMLVHNTADGTALEVQSGGKSIVTYNDTETSIEINSGASNRGLVINSGATSSGNPIEIIKGATTKLSVNQGGEITASKLIKQGGTASQYLMADGSTSNVLGYTPVNKAGDTMMGDLILNQDPGTALGAATKQYVDNIASGINFHKPVYAATISNLVADYDNGVDGVGATLTATSYGELVVDSHTVPYLQRVLVWQQTDNIKNGIYDLTIVGDGETHWELTRSSDADNSPPGEIEYGDYTLVLTGDINGGYGFICNTPGTIDIGITGIDYVQFNAAQAVTAGYGLQELLPNVVSIDPAQTQEKITLATTGTTGAATFISNTLNIPTLPQATASASGYLTSGDWAIFNGKANVNSQVFTGTPSLPTGTIAVTQIAGTNNTTLATTAFATTALNGKMNNPSLTASYIPKALTATTIGNSRLLDTGTYLGIDTLNAPVKDITLGRQNDKVIGIEQSDSYTQGRTLVVEAGRTINFAESAGFISNGQTISGIETIAKDPYNVIWVLDHSGNNYYKPVGSNLFILSALSTAPLYNNRGNTMAFTSTNDLYLVSNNLLRQRVNNSGAWVNTGITCNFVAIDGNDVYIAVNGVDIYKKTNNTGSFVALGTTPYTYQGLMVHAITKDIYISTSSNILKLSGGTYTTVANVGAYSLFRSSTNDFYYANASGTVFRQTNFNGAFVNLGAGTQGYGGSQFTEDELTNIFTPGSGTINILQLYAVGISNLQGGTLKLYSGTGKGTGASDIEMWTGQVKPSGTDMQDITLRAKIDNTGLMTLPSVTNALIDADSTGKAVVTKEYLGTSSYWTKTGNDIYNNTSGTVLARGAAGGLYDYAFKSQKLSGSSWIDGGFSVQNGGNVVCAYLYPANIQFASGGSLFIGGGGPNGPYFSGIGGTYGPTGTSYWKSNIKIKYTEDLSASYDDRTLVDKGYITSYTTAQLTGKMNNPSLTASYIPKALTATTIGNSRLFDTDTYLGIGTVNTPTKDITLGYQTNREIGIELSDSLTVGRDLTVTAGKTVNYQLSSNFVTLSQTVQAYRKGGAASNKDFYISSGSILYKQSLGSGNLALYYTSSYTIYSTAVDSSGNIYIATANGLYKQAGGTGSFALESAVITRSYYSMAFHPDGHLYAVTGAVDTGSADYIYKRTNNTGDFVTVSVGTANYNDIACAPNGDVYASQWGTGIIKQTGGNGTWSTVVSSTSTGTVCVLSNGTIYAANVYGGIIPYFYISINNGTSFSTSSVTLPATYNSTSAGYPYLVASGNNVYAYGFFTSNIFFQNNESSGTADLQGGTLKLYSGTGKGTGASDIEMWTGQGITSGTNMQTATLRAKINNTGLMTLPSVTNALIEADTTGKAVVTKEYVNNRLVVETTSGYTLTNTDSGGIVIFKTTAAQTLTIPTGLADGFECTFVTLSGVTLTVPAVSGITLNNATYATGSNILLPQLSFTLKRMLTANTYIATGGL